MKYTCNTKEHGFWIVQFEDGSTQRLNDEQWVALQRGATAKQPPVEDKMMRGPKKD